MDSKRLIVLVLVSMALLMGWNYFLAQHAKRNNWELAPRPQQETPATTVVRGDTGAGAPEIDAPKSDAQSTTATPSALGGLRVLNPSEQSKVTQLGSAAFKDPRWSMGVDLISRGAAVGQVTLNQFPRSEQARQEPFVFQRADEAALPSMATSYATIDGQRVNLGSANWQLAQSTDSAASYVIEIGSAQPAVRITKTITIEPRVDDSGNVTERQGYEAVVQHQVQNLTTQPLKVELTIAGPTLPPREIERGPDRSVIAGYNKNFQYPQASIIEAQAWPVESLHGDSAKIDITKGDRETPLIWAGLSSTYFDALVLPVAKEKHRTAEFIRSVEVRGLTGASEKDVIGTELLLQTQPLTVAPGATESLDLLVFFGPKARAVVKNEYYSAYPREYNLSLTTTGSCAICTIQWIVDLMVWLLRAFHAVLFDWGLAIIALVVLVRGLMHPLTRKSTISMHKMSKLAPEMERIKKKFADNPEEQQRAMMAFYKEHGAGQIFGCLPMFIQMPIWIALWSALHGTFELRLAPFLWGYTWIDDLAKPDRLITFAPINLFFFQLDAINLLPIGMALVFYLQQRYTPKPASMTPEQAQQQKMMQWMMVLLFPLMLYTGPSGLNLYIFTSTAVGMLESKWIRDHLKAREAAEAAAGPTFIDVPATSARNKGQAEKPSKPKGRFAQFMERMQKLAADAQKQAQQQQIQRQQKKKK